MVPSHSARRNRYLASPAGADVGTPTPNMLASLACMGAHSPTTTALVAAASGMSEKAAQRANRRLVDLGFASVIPVTRAALAGPESVNDASLLFGSAPNVFAPTRAGLRLLSDLGLIGEAERARALPTYGPRNALFIGHELGVARVYAWARRCVHAREGGVLAAWKSGALAPMATGIPSPQFAKPDAWLAVRLGSGDPPPTLVGLVEWDTGSERGDERWAQKATAYAALFSGGGVKEATGYARARLLVIVPTEVRRDRLAALIAQASPTVAGRAWLATTEALEDAGLERAIWRRPRHACLYPLYAANCDDSPSARCAGATEVDTAQPP